MNFPPPSPSESPPAAKRIVVYSNANTDPILAHAADYPYTHYILAFLVPDANGVVPSPPVQVVLDEPAAIRAVQAAGKKVMISLGGGAVTAAHWLDWGRRADAIAEQVAGIVKHHGLDGVGMDVENLPYTSAREFGPLRRGRGEAHQRSEEHTHTHTHTYTHAQTWAAGTRGVRRAA